MRVYVLIGCLIALPASAESEKYRYNSLADEGGGVVVEQSSDGSVQMFAGYDTVIPGRSGCDLKSRYLCIDVGGLELAVPKDFLSLIPKRPGFKRIGWLYGGRYYSLLWPGQWVSEDDVRYEYKLKIYGRNEVVYKISSHSSEWKQGDNSFNDTLEALFYWSPAKGVIAYSLVSGRFKENDVMWPVFREFWLADDCGLLSLTGC